MPRRAGEVVQALLNVDLCLRAKAAATEGLVAQRGVEASLGRFRAYLPAQFVDGRREAPVLGVGVALIVQQPGVFLLQRQDFLLDEANQRIAEGDEFGGNVEVHGFSCALCISRLPRGTGWGEVTISGMR
ncbi:hypothetical protein D3C78_1032200 [compost metagenome]